MEPRRRRYGSRGVLAGRAAALLLGLVAGGCLGSGLRRPRRELLASAVSQWASRDRSHAGSQRGWPVCGSWEPSIRWLMACWMSLVAVPEVKTSSQLRKCWTVNCASRGSWSAHTRRACRPWCAA